MKQENFATGNWYVKVNCAGAIEVTTDSDQYLCIGVVSDDEHCTSGEITKATSSLISAAPDMYWLITDLRKECDCSDELKERMSNVISKSLGFEG